MGTSFLKKGTTLVVKVSGDIDHHNAGEIKRAVDNEISFGNYKNIMFDFKNVSFMDSSGIGMVIGRYKQAQALGGKVGVFNMSKQVENIFELSGLFKIVWPFAGLEEGLQSFGQEGIL